MAFSSETLFGPFIYLQPKWVTVNLYNVCLPYTGAITRSTQFTCFCVLTDLDTVD